MGALKDNRDAWLEAGWKRGCFIQLDSNVHLREELPQKLIKFLSDKESVYIIPVLYDCALIDNDFDKEPWAQVVVVWKTDFCRSLAHAKSPRRLHFFVDCDQSVHGSSEICFEVSAISFQQVDRELLLSATPDKSISWRIDGLPLLIDWVAERYRQATFPDSFNGRLHPLRKGLEKLWKSQLFSENVSGVYFRLNTMAELGDGHDYEIDVMITIPYSFKGKQYREIVKKHEDDMVTKLKSLLVTACNIVVNSVQVISEREFTKETERLFNRFSLEYFSYRTSDAPLPSEYYGE